MAVNEEMLNSVAGLATTGSGRTSTTQSLASFTETYQVPADPPEMALVVVVLKGAIRISEPEL